ncbi:MAG TPA: alpha/beta fold hydrolase [Pseudonocardiaceae bacterium]|nr:alpha/beta fold hydrolase [Pseudonocardiaceae bacterium]
MTAVPAAARSPWFIRPKLAERSSRLFCFPYSGTGASAFHFWPAAIEDIEVCPVQFPGRESRLAEPHYGTYENLAASLIEPMLPRLDRPFAFFGHCAGALPAFETAVLLAELGLPEPDCLFVSGQAAPHEFSRDRMLTMTDAELRAEIESVVRGRGIEPRPDMIDVGLSVLLRDLEAAEKYRRPEPVTLNCPIVVLHWRSDPEISLEELEGWRQYSDSVEIRVVEGGHHDFMDAPEELTKLLQSWV